MRAALLAVCLAGSVLLPVAAQEGAMTIRGRIIGPDETSLSGQPVVLHRVQGSEGTTIAEALTSATGEFELTVPAQSDTTAIYFVAARYEGELYIGPAFRSGEQASAVQVIQVGIPGTSASTLLGGASAAPQPMGRAVTSRNWLLLVIPLLGVAAVAIHTLIPRSRIPRERALLIRVAELDECMTSAPGAQRETLLDERNRLLAQLRAN